MAITVHILTTGYAYENYFSAAGMTDGNEHIFQLDPGCTTLIEALLESAGSALLRSSLTETPLPSGFTGFTSDVSAVTETTTWNLPAGLRWIGLDVASGTWTIRVRQIRVGAMQ